MVGLGLAERKARNHVLAARESGKWPGKERGNSQHPRGNSQHP